MKNEIGRTKYTGCPSLLGKTFLRIVMESPRRNNAAHFELIRRWFTYDFSENIEHLYLLGANYTSANQDHFVMILLYNLLCFALHWCSFNSPLESP